MKHQGVGTVVMSLPANRRVVLLRTLVATLVLVALVVILRARSASLFWSTVPAILLGALVLPRMVRMLLKGKAVELTDRGIVNYTSELRFVEWNEIERARLEKQMAIETIVFELKDNGPVLARIPLVSRMLLLFSIKRYGLRPSISATFIEGGVEHGLREIQHRLESWRS